MTGSEDQEPTLPRHTWHGVAEDGVRPHFKEALLEGSGVWAPGSLLLTWVEKG